MPHPDLSHDDEAAFDELLARTPEGGVVDYDLQQPKWWFLHHQIQRGYLVHGSNEPAIDEFRTRANLDAHQRPIEAVFASDDAIWPLYFAVVNRAGRAELHQLVRARRRRLALHLLDRLRPGRRALMDDGTIYLLPRATFRATPSSRELVSERAGASRRHG